MLSYFSRQKTAANKWEHSSAGRASALQAEGHRFEPYCSHHYGLVVQLVRTLACHARGRRFDPDPGRQFASVAQSVEQGTENPRVGGSIPPGGTSFCFGRSHLRAFKIFFGNFKKTLDKSKVLVYNIKVGWRDTQNEISKA